MVLIKWPVSGAWVIGLVVGVALIVNGWACIFVGLAARAAWRTSEATKATSDAGTEGSSC